MPLLNAKVNFEYTKREIHVFCDASIEALGFCIYVRYLNDKAVHCALLCAGSRLAPRAATSIPRLELCSAVEASTAAAEVCRELDMSPG